MERGIGFIFLVTFILVVFFCNNVSAIHIVSKATYAKQNISIVIDTEPPVISILSPLNRTYDTNTSLSLNYSVTDASPVSGVWYNIDSGNNITLAGNTTFNTTEGNHILTLYARDSVGFENKTSVNFSVVLSEEEDTSDGSTPPTGSGGSSGGGGGGGGIGAEAVRGVEKDFAIDKDLIQVTVEKGESTREFLRIKNTGDTKQTIVIDPQNLKEFMVFPGIDGYSFELEPGQEKIVDIVFGTGKDQEPDIYPGKVLVKSGTLEEIILVIVEVESREPLFDVSIEIPKKYREVFPGEEIVAGITIFNIKGIGLVDVRVDYAIKDMEGNTMIEEHETKGVERQISYVKTFDIPALEPQDYVFYVKVGYEGIFASASQVFKVAGGVLSPKKEVGIMIIIIDAILIFLAFIWYEHFRLREMRGLIKKVNRYELLKRKLIKKRRR